MPGPVRFTPDEIKELIDSGQLTAQDIQKMHPADQQVAIQMGNFAQGPDGQLHATRPFGQTAAMLGASMALPALATAAGTGAMGAGVAGGVISAGKYAGNTVKTGAALAGTNYVLRKAGMPPEMADIITMGMALGHGPGKAAAEAPAMSEAEAALRKSLQERYGLTDPAAIDRIVAQSGMGRTAPTLDPMAQRPGRVKLTPPNAASAGPDMVERVTQGGVQNDFRGPVSFAKPSPQDVERQVFGLGASPYSANISTEEDAQALMDRVLRESASGQPSPLIGHDDEGNAIVSAAKSLKKKVARRSPQ